MNICPVCGVKINEDAMTTLSSHIYSEALSSDPAHVMWLNRVISRKRLTEDELTKKMVEFYDFSKDGLAMWIRRRFVERFFSDDPNIFVLDMQNHYNY